MADKRASTLNSVVEQLIGARNEVTPEGKRQSSVRHGHLNICMRDMGDASRHSIRGDFNVFSH